MHLLLFSIISGSSIFILFKLLGRLKTNTFYVIIINYLTATIFGFIISSKKISLLGNEFSFYSWIPLILIIGSLFICMFYLIAKSTQIIGISITTISSKVSLLFPVLFSVLFDPDDSFNLLKLSGIILGVAGIIFVVFKKKSKITSLKIFFLPVILFFGTGLVDSLLKLAQYKFIDNDTTFIFTTFLFSIAGIIGIFILFLKPFNIRDILNIRLIGMGMILGICNFWNK